MITNSNNMEQDYAYIAGLLEGEGSFVINKEKLKNGKFKYTTKIVVSTRERECLDFLIKVFPTNINIYNNRMYSCLYKTIKTEEIISKIYPYLSFKKSQADCLNRIIQIKKDFNGKTPVANRYEEIRNNLIKSRISDENMINNNSEIPNETNLLAYAAGLIDGEGSFGIYARKRNKINIYSSFCIMMNNKEGIQRISKILGRPIYKYKKVYVLKCNDNRINGRLFIFLKKIIPFLKLKKQQAILCLDLIKNKNKLNPEEQKTIMVKCKEEKNNKQIGDKIISPIYIPSQEDLVLIKQKINEKFNVLNANKNIVKLAKKTINKIITKIAKYKYFCDIHYKYSEKYARYNFSLGELKDYIDNWLLSNSLQWEDYSSLTDLNDGINIHEYSQKITQSKIQWGVIFKKINSPKVSDIIDLNNIECYILPPKEF